MKNIIVIGSGFSSLAAACYLAKNGHQVSVYEKNDTIGGRARQLKRDGFTFDMGPTWYWMPDVFDRFFADFGKKTSDFYGLEKLSPAYKVYFEGNESITIPSKLEEIIAVFDTIEKGSGKKLSTFIASAKENYRIAIGDLVYNPGVSVMELLTFETFKKIGLFFKTISQTVRSQFKDDKLIRILEFPVLFLGAKPSKTPAFYNFMNFADFGLGTWYPENGMYNVVKGIQSLAVSLGVEFHTNASVEKIEVEGGKVKSVVINGKTVTANIILSGADYHHTEKLLEQKYRAYSEKYWKRKTFAPSCLLFYVGFNKKIESVLHHTLFFDTDFDAHAKAIYDNPDWPLNPLFYASFPSKTDKSCAPNGKEAAIFLIPLAPGLEDSDSNREKYFELLIARLEKLTAQSLKQSILFVEYFGIRDFVSDYNSYKGNAYGLANTLMQTAIFRPKIKSNKVKNLYFTGQLTVPGPGVPPALISGKIAAEMIQKNMIP